MASIETRKGKKKTTHRVKYNLWVNGKKRKNPEKEPFDNLEEAKVFLSVAEVIESKSKRNLASPAEVALWVEQKYIKRESAAKAFPLYRDSLLNKGESFVDIDWEVIKETYATKRLFKASDKDDMGENHLHKMSHFDRVKEFLVKRHPDLRVSKTDVQKMMLELQHTGHENGPMRAQTRAHWLYALRMIFEVAEELQMMTGGNPTNGVTVSIPSRPKYVVRVILDQETAKKMLKTSRDMLDSTFIEQVDSLDYTRVKPRVPHPLREIK